MPTGKCRSCDCERTLTTTTIRMYEKRAQYQWVLRLCRPCRDGCMELLNGISDGRTDSLFHVPDARSVIVNGRGVSQ